MKQAWMALVLLCLALTAAPALGHHYWIMPETFQPAPGTMIDASFTAAHTYFANEEVPDVTRFGVTLVTPTGQTTPLAYSRISNEAAWVKVPVLGEGTYVIEAVSTSPDYYCQMKDDWKPGRKTEHQGVVRAGMYIKSIKTFFTAGKPTENYSKVMGHAIEMVPQVNPTTLKAGQTLAVKVLYQGKPVGKTPVFALYEGFKAKDHADIPVKTETDGQGLARIKLDRPGKWIVYAKHEIETKGNPDADYENCRPYLMFEVGK
ncbi:MAG: DUF4198 domain-containing protein [Proteobacteria bacterium]|nr:DUF4198 domain-containing protein [Pseudomonadota bacterium]